MKKHLTVEIQVGVNERENRHLGASLESRKRERTDLQGKNSVMGLKSKNEFLYKLKQHY